MPKFFWVALKKWNKELATAALEAGADALYVEKGVTAKAHELGLIKTIAPDGDLVLGRDVEEVTINEKKDEDKAVNLRGKIPVIIRNKDWTIIPLENLISKTTNLIQTVTDAQHAKLALETMEKGADGILLETDLVEEILKTAKVVRAANNENLALVRAKIVSTEAVGIADRVCVDTASLLEPGKGLLVGDSSSALFLVYNENVPSPYCDPRPFRVNAGAVHAYVRLPNNKTKYLSELCSGEQVLVIDPQGNTEMAVVGRVKIEKRPMLLVKATAGEKLITLVMQNAETIRLTTPEGKPISITHLKKGDEVLAYLEEAGRHFGVKVSETIRER
jgi:3-dehydroquinate synthase II